MGRAGGRNNLMRLTVKSVADPKSYLHLTSKLRHCGLSAVASSDLFGFSGSLEFLSQGVIFEDSFSVLFPDLADNRLNRNHRIVEARIIQMWNASFADKLQETDTMTAKFGVVEAS